jgi:hypothetical protein
MSVISPEVVEGGVHKRKGCTIVIQVFCKRRNQPNHDFGLIMISMHTDDDCIVAESICFFNEFLIDLFIYCTFFHFQDSGVPPNMFMCATSCAWHLILSSS